MNRYEACQLLCTERAPHGSSKPEWSSLPQTTAGRLNSSYKSLGPWSLGSLAPIWKFSRVSSNAWRGTVAAQTNEQCLSNMQDTLGAGSSSDKEFCVKVLTRSSLSELLPGPSLWIASQHPTQDSRFNTIQTKAPCVCLRCTAVSLARHRSCPD